MDNCSFSRKTLNTKGNRIDRFIYHREYLTEKRQYWRPNTLMNYNNFWDIKPLLYRPLSRRKYICHLDKAFGVEKNHDECMLKPWPCKPRKKSFLTSANTVLDLPNFNYSRYPELLDWSSHGTLVAARGRKYYKWSWDKESLVGRGHTSHNIQTCKFSPNGYILALGMEFNIIEIHDSEMNKYLMHLKCSCRNSGYYCSITTMDWSPKSNGLIVACCRSVVTSFDNSMEVISSLKWSNAQIQNTISSVRMSPDARFAAITIKHSTNIFVVEWPSLQKYKKFHFEGSFTTAISWHPWGSALLGRGGYSFINETSNVTMCSVLNGNVEATLLPGKYDIDGMLFSSKTGELVMSLYGLERGSLYPKKSSRLVVLSNMTTIVDQWSDDSRNGLNRLVSMIFSPDGTKLATATLDEDLVFWNFLPETKEKTKLSKFVSSSILR